MGSQIQLQLPKGTQSLGEAEAPSGSNAIPCSGLAAGAAIPCKEQLRASPSIGMVQHKEWYSLHYTAAYITRATFASILQCKMPSKITENHRKIMEFF